MLFKTEPLGHELTAVILRPPRQNVEITVKCECGDYERTASSASVQVGKKNINMSYNVHLKEKGAR